MARPLPFLERLAGEVARRVGSLRGIRRSLEEMVAGFTGARGSRPRDYLGREDARRAYLALYAVPNAARAACVLGRAGARLRPGERALDAGAGPRSTALALAARSARDSEIVLLDHSGPALELAAELFAALFPEGPHVRLVEGDVDGGSLPGGPFEVVTAGHVLNELLPPRGRDPGPAREAALALARRAGTLVITEPAQRIPARALGKVRAALLEAGYPPLGPCPHHGPCPVLAPGRQDWCVTDVPFRRPAITREVDELLGLRRTRLTVAWLAVRRGAPLPPAGTAEVLSRAMKTRDGPLYYLCTNRGRVALLPPRPPRPPLARGEWIRLPAAARPEGRDRSGAPRLVTVPVRLPRRGSS